MVFFKPLLLVAGAYLLYSYFRGDDRAPPPPPPPPRSPSPQRGTRAPAKSPPPSLLYSSPTIQGCQCDACQRPQRRTAVNVPEYQRLSSQNPARHVSRTKSSSPTELYQSQDYQYPKIEQPRNVEVSNEADKRDPHYLRLRSEAKKYHTLMVKCFEESRQARSQGDHTRARELSEQAREYEKLMKRLDEQACDWIFEKNNKGNRPYTVDLHGLYSRGQANSTKHFEPILDTATNLLYC